MKCMASTFFCLSLCAALLSACGGSSSSGKPVAEGANPEPKPTVLCEGDAVSPERLFLQQLSHDRVIIKWRGNVGGGEEANEVCIGSYRDALPAASLTTAVVTETGHREALITGLKPDSTYYYSVGGAATAEAGHYFRTAPLPGQLPTDGNTRIWILGDPGSAGSPVADDAAQVAVRDGYHQWISQNGGEETDILLTLGDNAYFDGTDAQHQTAMFDIYTDTLAKAAIWSTIGNHEMGSFGTSMSPTVDLYLPLTGLPDLPPDSPMPYLNIFSYPTNGEVGGVPSGTEQYYSFDYGNLHVVSLDSQVTARDEANSQAMRDWLIADLQSNTKDWTIVIFHHPPYSKASHDSDSNAGGVDQPIFEMREKFNPILEDYRVDLVYNGHSHSYERSYYIRGHYGLSDSFDVAEHAELNSDGSPTTGRDDQAYGQISNTGMDDRVVYSTAGSSGQTGGLAEDAPHEAHFFTADVLGSVLVDVKRDTLNVKFIDDQGVVQDYYTLTR